MWSAIILYSFWPVYEAFDNSTICLIIGWNKSVSKFESTFWKIQHHLSRPAPVSIFLFGNSS